MTIQALLGTLGANYENKPGVVSVRACTIIKRKFYHLHPKKIPQITLDIFHKTLAPH
jgi:hypothetical protein